MPVCYTAGKELSLKWQPADVHRFACANACMHTSQFAMTYNAIPTVPVSEMLPWSLCEVQSVTSAAAAYVTES